MRPTPADAVIFNTTNIKIDLPSFFFFVVVVSEKLEIERDS
jgi:hypothetical protein